MKKVVVILLCSSLVISALIGIIFGFIEFRSLFAGDFALMNNPAASFFSYLFRGLYFLTIIITSILVFKSVCLKHKTSAILLSLSIALLASGFVTFIFYEFYFSLLILLACLFIFISALSNYLKKTKTES